MDEKEDDVSVAGILLSNHEDEVGDDCFNCYIDDFVTKWSQELKRG